MQTWITSDTHFGHARILELSGRPFKDTTEMEEVLVENWNSRVAPSDFVYHLGDFAMHPRDDIPRILSRLNGHIVLIEGNHDHKRTLTNFTERHKSLDYYHCGAVGPYTQGVWVHMVHNPADAKPAPRTPLREGEGLIVLCGHVHEKWGHQKRGSIIPADEVRDHAYRSEAFTADVDFHNVGVDVRGYRPVTLEEILEQDK